MMKTKSVKTVLAILLVLVMAVSLSACGSSGGSSSGDVLKGNWEGESDDGIKTTWNFNGKGVCKMENEYGAKVDGTYSVDGDTLMMQMDEWEKENKYEITIDGDKLSIVNVDDSYRPNYELNKK